MSIYPEDTGKLGQQAYEIINLGMVTEKPSSIPEEFLDNNDIS